jgi:two-component system, OmpR family, sensor histidine kinase MtrB
VIPERIVPRGRMRRRLTIAFMLAAGISAAALAGGSYLVVRDSRLDDSLNRSLEQARATLVLAATLLGGSSDPATAEGLVAALERRAGFDAVVIAEGEAISTSLSLGEAQVPQDLRAVVEGGGLAYQRTEIRGEHELVIGGKPFGSEAEVYFFFSEEQIYADLRELAVILFAGTGVLVVLAGIGGALLARRTLRPVAQASEAAHSLAEGLLDTRLPVDRHDEFGAWAASFNKMADALEQKIDALSEAQARERRFTADVAHELRTPITALMNEAALVRQHLDDMPPGARRAGELLVHDVARLRRLVDELLEISRLDAGRESVEPTRVDLSPLVSGMLRARGWEGEVALSGDDVVLDTDPRRLERIVGNLVENALEHGGGDVSVAIKRENSAAQIAVADRGPGIDAEHLPHVFDRFYKADPARAGHGTGLGLAIARENARLLGGDIAVESLPGVGARFTVRLPVTEPLPGGKGSVAGGWEHGE